jgi:hypothetical protein
MRYLTLLLLTAVLMLTACATPGGDNPAVSTDLALTGTATIPDSGSPTATIVWFPATATWTPFPTIEPSATPQYFPGLGEQVYQDDFSDMKNWSSAKQAGNGGNSIILERNRLTLAANVPPVTLFSLNNNLTLTDFYAEINVSVNRCYGPDSYGMIFRAASSDFAYRYLLNCSGKARVELIRGGRSLPLQDWVISGDAPPGAPGQVKMGIWAAGSEMRFFLNDHYQFSVIDRFFKNGGLGVFASSSSPDGMNISFSDLTVNSVSYVSPTPTVTPSKTATQTRTPQPTP